MNKTIIKSSNNDFSLMYPCCVLIDLIGYISFHNFLIELYERSDQKSKERRMMEFANPPILKDYAIVVHELYTNLKKYSPKEYEEMIKDKRHQNFFEYVKNIRKNMKHFPKKVRRILAE